MINGIISVLPHHTKETLNNINIEYENELTHNANTIGCLGANPAY